MKKSFVYVLSLAVLVTAFAACQKAGIPVAGSAKAEDMLTLIPKTVQGVFVIDVHRGMNIAFVDKAVKSGEDAAKYQEIISKVGIDPQKDVYFAAIGTPKPSGPKGKSEPQVAGVINLKYDQAKVVAAIKEKSPAYQETAYEGVTIFTVPEESAVPEEGANRPQRRREADVRRVPGCLQHRRRDGIRSQGHDRRAEGQVRVGREKRRFNEAEQGHQ